MLKGILYVILILMTIVIVHEFGHFIAAKIFGVYVEEFSIGMGPALYSHQFKETKFSIRALPIGGFCKMVGEQEDGLESKHQELDVPPERTLNKIAKWKQIIIFMGGIFMNIVLSLFLMTIAYSTYNISTGVIVDSQIPQIREGDVLLKINDDEITNNSEIRMWEETGETVEVTIYRNENVITENISPVNGSLGIQVEEHKMKFTEAIVCAWNFTIYVGTLVIQALKQLVTTTDGVKNIGSVISVYNMVSPVQSLVEFMAITSLISVNVGIINAIPLPTMDGGRVVLLLIEAIRGKPLKDKTVEVLFGISLVLLVILLLISIGSDILRLVGIF